MLCAFLSMCVFACMCVGDSYILSGTEPYLELSPASKMKFSVKIGNG